jgi:hypothetical protein
MALLTKQAIDFDGVTPAYVAAAGGGDQFLPGRRTFFHIKNGGGAPITVTFATPGTVDGLAVADNAVSVTNAQERMIGPFDPATYAQADDSRVDVTYSAVTSVTVGVFELP